jgi:pyruvate/2-oxoglutarate dehydrogenase complex dihydrolipoamide acyltransferase (E2) component
MTEIVMPRLSDSMEEGTILTWLKQVGDEVAVGDELVEIETDKANMAYEADVAGTLNEILAQEGETLPIGSPIARIGEAGEAPKAGGAQEAQDQASQAAGPVTAGDPPPLPVAKASSGEVPPTVPPAAGAPRTDTPDADADPGPEEEEEAEVQPPGAEAAAPAGGELSLDEIQRAWPAVLQKLSETAPALAATFEGARPVEFEDEGLVIGFPAGMAFNKRKAEGPERRDAAAAAFEAVVGRSLKPSFVLLGEGDEGPPPDTPAPGSEEIDEEELLERLKSEFDAEEVS